MKGITRHHHHVCSSCKRAISCHRVVIDCRRGGKCKSAFAICRKCRIFKGHSVIRPCWDCAYISSCRKIRNLCKKCDIVIFNRCADMRIENSTICGHCLAKMATKKITQSQADTIRWLHKSEDYKTHHYQDEMFLQIPSPDKEIP